MESQIKIKGWCKEYPGERPPRFLRAFLLFFIGIEESHGYDLIEKLKNMGIHYENYELGYVYKTLRTMEKEGLIKSKWNLQEKGNARRIYAITKAGRDNLAKWAEILTNLRDSIDSFLGEYERIYKKEQNN
ncbi:MAG: PadR family transcriptional regulator [Desulfurella sp.]|uniref:Transcriptional regulator, PadR family n=1 Tax=Desulfurella multipotens TaxID=79269 RepID=A0A1G6LQA6_9BACT|nr:PadR family transcriptional regulator [Desulfurella multipotens]AHF97030.1 PadR family transcriptional regulator [Desulfurella acetivorans A63]SDC45478.1 transcriptional regulator, PadR family [Desulfurella multipotens]